ncbi:clostripain-related cysteine peptidase [Microcoleus sp. OTE_8_concoct_300]|uniref:clostripain-related cysteine peptidase n=1 Tax=Microcoleus sp. OTE_8_concoct_300 TaxID=2964710 RepID=UPI00403F445E
MKRRETIQYLALSSASFFTAIDVDKKLVNNNWLAANKPRKNYDYILLYWMPYDNDLSRFGQPIIEMLSKGVQSDKVLVLVQSDLSNAKHLSRNIITKGNINVQYLETADSSSENVLNDYLSWALSQFQAKHWVIVFLGHGGSLMKISPDNNPNSSSISSSEPKWMQLPRISEVVSKFNQAVKGRLELLFFQNCNRGNIEVHYTFQNIAKYTLSSQIILAAPNYYYESLLNHLSYYPNLDGGQIAKKIMDFEPSDMYHSLTLTKNHYFHQLSEKLNPVIDSILRANTAAVKIQINLALFPKKSNSEKSLIEIYRSRGETFVDLANFILKITILSGADVTACNRFLNFYKSFLIERVQQNGKLLSPRIRGRYQKFSGLGLFLPKTRQELETYSYLKIYSDLKLVKLFEAVVFDP